MDKFDKHIIELQKKTAEHNVLAAMALKDKRRYITPEDIGEALKTHPVDKIRLDTLEILAENAGFGAEDSGLCAFVAFEGKPTEEDDEEEDEEK